MQCDLKPYFHLLCRQNCYGDGEEFFVINRKCISCNSVFKRFSNDEQ